MNSKIERYFAIKIRLSLKIQKNHKTESPSMQLYETVNFTFMRVFALPIKPFLGYFSFFLRDLCHAFMHGSSGKLGP